ncbi:hypothetical protein [Vibrio sp. 99-70-13A1]|uniref:DUF6162 family protein n=1 Tax=Vibrio sp. 99-70-13A1 TaxID=2607601 RepID=UPI00149357A3|nr:hypothetical protein [Vibrio sp. 99-70-13A1]NOH98688.1 hypothetical protein [Vibrio sp. 99-70-13A1]
MITQSVRPDTGDREGKWVGFIIVLILAFATVAIPFHQANTQIEHVEQHQILVTDVKKENLAMLSELRLAHEEIRDIYLDNDGEWPSVNFLEDEWIAPFVKDQSWKRKGQHLWTHVGNGYYFSAPSQSGAANAFLLNTNVMSPDIWISLGGSLEAPSSYEIEYLKSLGWKQVVTAASEPKNKLNDVH